MYPILTGKGTNGIKFRVRHDNIIVLTFLINLYKFVFFILLSWKAHLGSINKVYVCMYVYLQP